MSLYPILRSSLPHSPSAARIKDRWLVRLVLYGLVAAAVCVFAMPQTHVYADSSAAISAAPGEPINDPMRRVKGGVGEVLAVFKDQQIPLRARREKLRELAEKYFDFESMARSVMGYHWRELSTAQREQFVPLFANFIEDAYLTKLQDYTVQKVQEEIKSVNVQFTHESFDGADYAEVFSNIIVSEQKDPIRVNYLMHFANGEWKIYDVTVESISVVGNYRNQFSRVMNNDGYDKLVADLQTKLAGLQRDLDNPQPTPSGQD
jgi:phospholipid transport system substrate-binding protein